jgi:methylenetetrahydrofolate dehydrogenase (NADP+)/methenyltetrahydrofolate cyclohydrolase
MFLPGNSVAENILTATKAHIQEHNSTPGLGVILVGEDAPSHLYVGIKEKRAAALGITFEKKIFPKEVSQQELEQAIALMNADEKLHGIIVQLPLPEHLDTERIISAIDPQKDTDGFHPVTIEKYLAGDTERLPVFPRAMLELVRVSRKQNEGERGKALAIVNSDLMGSVLVTALTSEGFEARYVFGSEKKEIETLLPEQAVVLTAVGTPDTFSTLTAQAGAVIIDGGIFYDEKGRVVGDVTRDDGVYREDIFVTPVPGGVGPVTVAVLLARVTEAALRVKG